MSGQGTGTAAEWVPANGGLAALRRAATQCRGCELWEPATQVVFSSGRADARLMLVGEQPGDVEDREGVPFVGPAGRLLQGALEAAGAERSEVYLTNAVKHFRFTQRGKRRIHATPDTSHIVACRPWLEAELTRLRPALVVCLGATAAKSLLGSGFRVTKERGRVFEREVFGRQQRFLATVHPSSILRIRGDEHDVALAALVADLSTAVAAVRQG